VIRARSVLARIAVALVLSACTDGLERGQREGNIESLPEWRLAPEPRLVIGVVDGSPEYELDDVSGAVMLSDGRIVVGEARGARLRVYDRDGRHIADWGREGRGPGEFGYVLSVHVLGGDSLAVDDVLESRITVLTPEGRFVRMLPRPPRPTPAPGTAFVGLTCCRLAGVFRDGSMLILGPGTVSLGQRGRQWSQHVLLRLSVDGTTLDTIGVFPGRPVEVDPATGDQRPMTFGANFEYAALDDRVFAGNGASDTITVLSPDGEPLPGIRLLRARQRVTREMRDALDSARAASSTARGNEQGEAPRARPVVYADSLPSHSRLATDRSGRLWVYHYLPPPVPADADMTFTVFERDGRAVARARIPVRLMHRLWIGESEAVVVASDSLGVEQVRVYPIVVSSN